MTHYPYEPVKPRRRWLTPTITALIGLGIGATIGTSGTTPAPAAEPAEVITETVTETVEVEVTPKVCLDAIDSARSGFTAAAEAMGVIPTAIEAAFYRDTAGMEAATADLEAINADITSNNFAAQASRCEASR